MALAEPQDVADALGRDLTDAETARVEQLLDLASSAVETQTGRRFEPGQYTIGRKVRSGRVRLPVSEATVTAVRSLDTYAGALTTLTDFTAHGAVVYGLWRSHEVEVDFTISDDIPDDIVDLVSGVVAGLVSSPVAGLTSELVGPYQATYGNNSGRIFFSATDKLVLRKYAVPTLPSALI